MTQNRKYDPSIPEPQVYAISECKKTNLILQGLGI